MKAVSYYLVFFFCLGLDRISKSVILKYFSDVEYVVNSLFSINLSWNRGISWGMLQFDSPVAFAILSVFIILIVLLLTIYTFVKYRSHENVFGETLVLAGAVSNILDRFWYNAVVDFLDFHFNKFSWPVFNVADACIVLGVGIIITKNLLKATNHDKSEFNRI
jgi:signal peptidase II